MPDIEQKIEEITGLISLPEIYLKVRRLMDDETSEIDDFAQVIIVDPNLSTRVLKIVNSAYFGFQEPVDSITRAINMIGIGQLHNMVLGVAAISSLDLPNDILRRGACTCRAAIACSWQACCMKSATWCCAPSCPTMRARRSGCRCKAAVRCTKSSGRC
jgi:HD-like signal output (HDOD) protein